jgi:hypothetical protein
VSKLDDMNQCQTSFRYIYSQIGAAYITCHVVTGVNSIGSQNEIEGASQRIRSWLVHIPCLHQQSYFVSPEVFWP